MAMIGAGFKKNPWDIGARVLFECLLVGLLEGRGFGFFLLRPSGGGVDGF